MWKTNRSNSIRYGSSTFFSNFRETTFINKDASKEERAAAAKKVAANEKKFLQMKKEKAQEIVMLLDLFDGKITLTELLETDIPIINQLRDAKLELAKRQEIERQKNINQKASNKQSITLTDPSTLKKRG